MKGRSRRSRRSEATRSATRFGVRASPGLLLRRRCARWRGRSSLVCKRGISCRRLAFGPERFEERDECSGLRGAEIFSVRGHVAAALNHLANQLILREARRYGIERGAAHAAFVAQRMAVVALLLLEHERALAFERRTMRKIAWRNWVAAPRVHDRAPRRVAR